MFQEGQPKPGGGRLFVQWPAQKEKLKSFSRNAELGDLYFRPVLFTERRVAPEAVAGSLVTWADVDSAAPTVASAGLVVESGTAGHVHAYWPSERLLTPAEVVKWNWINAKIHGGDMSGYDLLQLLRVPGTKNHKTDPARPVRLVRCDPTPNPIPVGLDDIKVPKYRKPDILPSFETILENGGLSSKTLKLLSSPEPEDRSASMFNLACLLCEDGLSADESYVVLDTVDGQWGKFKGRHDRELRLTQCVARAYEKTLVLIDDTEDDDVVDEPAPVKKPEAPSLQLTGWASLALNIPPINWLMEGVLRENGVMILAGDAGVGKTQAGIQIAAKIVLGAKSWAGIPIKVEKPQKVLYLSLEMDQHGLDDFTNRMQAVLPAEALQRLEERLQFFASLDRFKLDTEVTKATPHPPRKQVETWIKSEGFTGVVIDTLRASISESLQDDQSVTHLIEWTQTMRSKYGVWFIILAHPRKLGSGQRHKDRELSLDEIYGSRVIGDMVDSAFALVMKDKKNDILQLQNLKTRYKQGTSPVNLRRTPNLWLEPTSQVPESDLDPGDFQLEDDTFNLEGPEWD